MARNPNDESIEEEYFFDVNGELIIKAYSEEEAEYQKKHHWEEWIIEAVENGDIEIF